MTAAQARVAGKTVQIGTHRYMTALGVNTSAPIVDGWNYAPALVVASVGSADGVAADAAVGSADVALMTRDWTCSTRLRLGFIPDDRLGRGGALSSVIVLANALRLRAFSPMAGPIPPSMDEANELDLRPGETKVLIWHFTRRGEFLFACGLQGHAQAGMMGKIHVS